MSEVPMYTQARGVRQCEDRVRDGPASGLITSEAVPHVVPICDVY